MKIIALFGRIHTTNKWSGACFLVLLAGFVNLDFKANAQVGHWVPLSSFSPNYNAGEMELMTDGTVLCKNSNGTGSGTGWDKLTPDIHGSYVNGTWTSIAPMYYDRLYFSTQVLNDGRLYVAGGEYGGGGTKGEVYSPYSLTWTLTPQIVTAHNISDANSEMLPDGSVLQAIVDTGGGVLNRIYYPATNTYSLTGSCLRYDNEAPWVKLPDNTVLFQDNYSTTSERYNPVTKTWINDGVLAGGSIFDPFGEEAGGAFLLPNGSCWFIGSLPKSAYYTPSGSVSPGTWTVGPAIPNNQGAPDACAAMMVNGKILMCVSPTPTTGDHFPDSTTFYEFDYTTNTYTMVGAPGSVSDTLDIPTYYTNMLCLPDGTILYCAQGDDQYYEYVPSGAPLAAGQPTINAVIRQSCDTFMVTGTLFNGITEGACYGDDWQMETNYPIIQLSLGTNVYYARSMNWNRPGAVMTGAALDTTTFVLPAGLPYGTYAIKVIANGNPSAASSITTNPVAITPSSSIVCTGYPTVFTEPFTGGTWSSSASGIAAVGSLTGIATGISAGTATISYKNETCVSVATVTVDVSPAVITPAGPAICVGGSVAVNDATPLGAWSSGAPGVATITGTTVSGVSAGTSVISYTVGSCFATDTVTVNPLPSAIIGSLAVCMGSSTGLIDPTSGGTWISGDVSVATIGSASGSAIGLTLGTSIISYVLTTTGCQITATLNVNPAPTAITGSLAVCNGGTSNLGNGVTGGTWSSTNTAVATVGSTSGTVSGTGLGTATISYSLGAGCIATANVTVNVSPASITGTPVVCTANTTDLFDGTPTGTWTSSNLSAATVGTTGIVSGVAPGSAVISYTIADGCSASQAVTIDLTPGAITGSSSVCNGASTLLGDPNPGGSWSTTSSTITIGTGSGLVTGTSFGTATVTYTLGGTCSTTTIITINESPGPISGPTTICVGLGSPLTDPAIGGAWSSANTAIGTIDGLGNVGGISAGTVIITYNLGAGCLTTTTVTVNNVPSPITGTTTICSSAFTELGDGVTGGTWTSSNLAVATVGLSSGLVSGVSAGSVVMSYAMGFNCYTTTTLTLVNSPSAITGATAVCVAGTSTLGDAIPGGTWSSSNLSVATIGTSGTATGAAIGTSIITYTLGTGCFATTTFNVTPPTAAAITGSATVCAGQTTTLADATGGGAWSSTNLLVASIGTSGVVTGGAPGTVTISYTVITACGTAYASKLMTVNANPAVAAITGVRSVCIGAATSLSDATPFGTWSSGSTAIGTVGATGIVSGLSAGTSNISYTITNILGCFASAVAAVTVTTPLAAVITPAGSTSICTGDSVVLDGTGGSGLAYQWMLGSVNISGATNATFTTQTAGNYTLSLNSGSGCVSVSPTVTVTVNPLHVAVPTDVITAVPGNILCLVTSPVAFTASSSSGGTSPVYQWFVNGTSVGSGTTYTYSPANGDVVRLQLTSNYVCASPDTAVTTMTMTISPNETPLVSITANPGSTVCTGESVLMTAIPVYGGTTPSFLWSKNGINVLTGPSYSLIPANGDVIKCMMTSDFACLASATATSAPITLHVNSPYTNVVSITISQSIIGAGASDTFTVSATHGGTSPRYQWLLNGAPVAGATSSVYVTDTLKNGQVVQCEVLSSDPCASPSGAVSAGITAHVGATGLNTINAANEFVLEPNPNKGVFTISGTTGNSADQTIKIMVVDMLGQTVYQEAIQSNNGYLNHQVQLPNSVANGNYVVNVISGTDQVIFHLVLDK